MKKKNKTTPKAAYRRERMAQALELRKSGMDYRTIGRAMNISRQTAHRYVTDGLKELTRESAQEVLTLELARYDQLLQAMFNRALNGDFQAFDRTLAVMARIDKLHDLEAARERDGAAETYGMLHAIFEASVAEQKAA